MKHDGENAPIHAAMRADELLEKGDFDGYAGVEEDCTGGTGTAQGGVEGRRVEALKRPVRPIPLCFHMAVDLHRLQTRSPAQELTNFSAHIKQRRTSSWAAGSLSGLILIL